MTVLEKNLAAIKLTQPDIAENLQHSRMGTAYKGITTAKTPIFLPASPIPTCDSSTKYAKINLI